MERFRTATQGTSFSNSTLEKLEALVQSMKSGGLQGKPSSSEKWCPSKSHIETLHPVKNVPATAPLQSSCSKVPCRQLPIVPRLSHEVWRSELDEQSEELDREIEALLAYWEHWPQTDAEDQSLETIRNSKWQQGHPLDLNDENIREDPNYDEAEVEREALQGYLAEELQQASCAEEEVLLIPPERLTGSSKTRFAGSKKLHVCLRRLDADTFHGKAEGTLGHASGTGSSREEEESGVALRKKQHSDNRAGGMGRPKRKSQGTCAGESKHVRRCQLSQENVSKRNPLRGHLGTQCQPEAGHQSGNSESSPSSSPELDYSKRYNFRHQSAIVRYAPAEEEQEEEDESHSIWDSEEDWSPTKEGCDIEENEEEEEAEDVEADARPVRNMPQKKDRPGASRCYPCPECGRKFSNSSNMWKHLRIHKGELPYGCHVCGKSYSDPSNLAKHQMHHTGERRHQCSKCPKAFYLKSKLEIHLRHHQGIRPFACLDCKKSFFSQAELVKHIKDHVLGRQLPRVQCKVCKKSFGSNSSLRRHPCLHVCDVCGKTFALKAAYKFHKKFHKKLHTGSCERCGVSGFHFCQAQERPVPPTLLSTQVEARPQDLTSSTTQNRPSPSDSVLLLPPLATCRPPPPPTVIGPVSSQGAVLSNRAPLPAGSPIQPATWPSGNASARPPALVSAQPFPQASEASPLSSAAKHIPISLVNLSLEPLSVTIPLDYLGKAPWSEMNPSNGAPKKNIILLDPATLPPGTKVTIQIPGQKIVPLPTPQTCPLCQTKYFGKHHCKVSHQDPARRGEEQPSVSRQEAEGKNTVGPQQPSPATLPHLYAQDAEELLTRSYNREAHSQVTYTEQRDGSNTGEDSEDDWQREESGDSEDSEDDEAAPAACAKRQRLFAPSAAKRRKGRYMCTICSKRFVYQRSLKQHMRMHQAFSCNWCNASFLQSEHLKWHMVSHAKAATT